MNIEIGLSGIVTVEKKRKNGEVTFRSKFNNVVLDSGFDSLLQCFGETFSFMVARYLFLGTGTTEPQKTDSGLEARSGTLGAKECNGGVNSTESKSYYDDTDLVTGAPRFYVDLRYDYGEGEAEGVWTELGTAYSSDYSRPYNRALFRDENGDPISVTVLSDEYLSINLTLVAQEGSGYPATYSTTLNGSNFDYTVNVNTTAFWKYAPPFGGGLLMDDGNSEIARATGSYDPQTKTATYEFVVDPTVGDEVYPRFHIVIRDGTTYYTGGLYTVDFSQSITKLADERLILPFSIQFSRGPDA